MSSAFFQLQNTWLKAGKCKSWGWAVVNGQTPKAFSEALKEAWSIHVYSTYWHQLSLSRLQASIFLMSKDAKRAEDCRLHTMYFQCVDKCWKYRTETVPPRPSQPALKRLPALTCRAVWSQSTISVGMLQGTVGRLVSACDVHCKSSRTSLSWASLFLMD